MTKRKAEDKAQLASAINALAKAVTKPAPKKKKQPLPVTGDINDYWAFMREPKFWFMPTRKLFPATSIDKTFGAGTTEKLVRQKPTHEVTWAPGLPAIIQNRLAVNDGWIDALGKNTFNLYIPPRPIAGDADKAGPWRTLGEKLWGEDQKHVEQWLAYRVQHPEIKINHALVVGSHGHGVGKDSYLAPLRRAVGYANFTDISAGRAYKDADDKNSFLQSVILRINEARDLGEKRFDFYDKIKVWCAAPPESMQVSDKWIVQHPIANLVGVIISSNHLTDGIYLDIEDRRHFVAWSIRHKEDFGATKAERESYWKGLWDWYHADNAAGIENVAAYLAKLDLSDFNPKAPPPHTQAWWDIVHANLKPEDSTLADVLDYAGRDIFGIDPPKRPAAFTLDMLRQWANEFPECNRDDLYFLNGGAKTSRVANHRISVAGYAAARASNKPELFNIGGKRQTVYVSGRLNAPERRTAVRHLLAYLKRRAERRKGSISPAVSEFANDIE